MFHDSCVFAVATIKMWLFNFQATKNTFWTKKQKTKTVCIALLCFSKMSLPFDADVKRKKKKEVKNCSVPRYLLMFECSVFRFRKYVIYCRHLGPQLLEMGRLIDKMLSTEFERYATADLNRPLETDSGVLEGVRCYLNSWCPPDGGSLPVTSATSLKGFCCAVDIIKTGLKQANTSMSHWLYMNGLLNTRGLNVETTETQTQSNFVSSQFRPVPYLKDSRFRQFFC